MTCAARSRSRTRPRTPRAPREPAPGLHDHARRAHRTVGGCRLCRSHRRERGDHGCLGSGCSRGSWLTRPRGDGDHRMVPRGYGNRVSGRRSERLGCSRGASTHRPRLRSASEDSDRAQGSRRCAQHILESVEQRLGLQKLHLVAAEELANVPAVPFQALEVTAPKKPRLGRLHDR